VCFSELRNLDENEEVERCGKECFYPACRFHYFCFSSRTNNGTNIRNSTTGYRGYVRWGLSDALANSLNGRPRRSQIVVEKHEAAARPPLAALLNPLGDRSAALRVAFSFVLLKHSPRCHFFGSATISARFLRALFYVFILALFFGTDPPKVFISRHGYSSLLIRLATLDLGRTLVFHCNSATAPQYPIQAQSPRRRSTSKLLKIQEILYFGADRLCTKMSWVLLRTNPALQAGFEGFMTVRILIADDHPVVRHGLRTLLGEHLGWEVIAEAADGMEAVEMADRLSPDVVVLDISMPKMHGLEACRLIRENAPSCEILIVTQHDSPQMLQEALLCGARGYVVKANAARDLLAAVDAVSQHRNFAVQLKDGANAG